MGWQDIGVFLIVAGALVFLFRRVFVRRRQRTQPAQTFIPLAAIKKRTDEGGGCH
jgi:hypothetical protein